MKLFLVFSAFVTLAAAQFFGNGGGNFFDNGGKNFGDAVGSLANNVADNVGNVANTVGDIANTAGSVLNSAVGILPSPPVLNNVNKFSDFVAQTGRTYASEADKTLREGLFTAAKAVVDVSNEAYRLGTKSFKLAVNAFADLTESEFLTQLTGNRKSAAGDEQASQHRQQAPPASGQKLPDEFDWRKFGGVTPVKFQKTCGSCWAFATAGAIEGHVYRKTNKLLVLSEQNMIDCGKVEFGLNGCDGGFQEYALEFVLRQGGLASGANYQYTNMQDPCKYSEDLAVANITGFAAIQKYQEDTMKEVVATKGPIACGMHGEHLLSKLDDGIYHSDSCKDQPINHSVLIVGYGVENGTDYWIIKNSWGSSWGEGGYFRLKRGTNECGIATECSYPIV